jgi:hypothetical protein
MSTFEEYIYIDYENVQDVKSKHVFSVVTKHVNHPHGCVFERSVKHGN